MSASGIVVTGTPLRVSDLEQLARSGISPDTAKRALLRRVGSLDGSQIVGRNGSRDYAGILFPYVWPGQDHVREYRLRRDRPEIENGKPKEKYLAPPGRGNMLYIPPGTAPEWLADCTLPIAISEGEKKALALSELAWHATEDTADRPRWLSIAISGGVQNWHGRKGKLEGPSGERLDETGPIPDLDRVQWQHRQITIIFDSNVYTNDDVRIARLAFAKHLRTRGTRVLFVDIPRDAGVNGVDDLVGAWGKDRVLELVTKHAYDPQKQKEDATESVIDVDAIPSVFSLGSSGIEFAVQDIVACGAVTAITGDPGAGKTSFVCSTGSHVAEGQVFLGRTCRQRKVLLLDQENALPIVQERLERLHIQDGGNFKVCGGWLPHPVPKPGGASILEWVQRTDPKPLIIVDSLIAFIGGDENDAQVMRAFMQQLRTLADLGCAVIVLHHSGKGESARSFRGSSDFKASVDVAYSLTNLGEGRLERLRLKAFKTRFTVENDLIVHYADGGFIADTRPDAVDRTVTERLIELLRLNPRITTTQFEQKAVDAGLGRNRGRQFLIDGALAGTILRTTGRNNTKLFSLVEPKKTSE